MKTLKELYKIVKAAGGDFPFEVESGVGQIAIALDQGAIEFWLEWKNDICTEGYRFSTKQDSKWKFPKDSPYLPTVDAVIYAKENKRLDEVLIKQNRQRWEDMGKPWGRLKEGAELLNYKGAMEEIKFKLISVNKIGALVDDGRSDWGIPFKDLRLSDKTLLNLDDWIEPETSTQSPCQFCKGKKELSWEEHNPLIINHIMKHVLPCPYCHPERFK